MDHKKVAQEVIDAIGADNIKSIAHCATRLRVEVKDKEKIDEKAIDNIDGLKGAFFNSGQYQMVFGTGTVNKVYEQADKILKESGSSNSLNDEKVEDTSFKKKNSNKNALQKAIRTFGDVFVPIIPVLVATGLFMGLRGLITQPEILGIFGLKPEDISQNFLTWTQILTDTAFAFLPALVCWSTFKVFGGSPVLGIVLGLMLVNPALPNAYQIASGDVKPIIMFGFIPVVGYQGTVLPAFISGLIGANLEKKIRSIMPDSLDLLFTPFLTLMIMSILSLFGIGPVFHSLENIVLHATEWVLGLPFGLAGIIIGGFHQLIVVTGIHHIFNFLEVQLLANTGRNAFNAILSAATVAQAGASLAVGIKTKDKKLKQIALPSAFSASLGITEPAIFGVNLRFVKPFICAMIGGAAGGFFASIMKLSGTGMSVTVLPGTLLYLDNILMYLIMLLIGGSVSFVLTYMFGFSDSMLKDK